MISVYFGIKEILLKPGYIRPLIIVIALLAGAWNWNIHSINLEYLQENFPEKISGGLVKTSDDASYIRPVQNFLGGDEWKDNFEGPSSYVQRPPGMGMYYGILIFLSGEGFPMIHRFIATLLFVIAIIISAYTVLSVTNSKAKTLIYLFTIGFLPCYSGWLSYYLTESISFSIVLIYSSMLISKSQTPSTHYTSSLLLSFILVLRPQLFMLAIPFIAILFSRRMNRSLKIISLLIAFLPFTLWEIYKFTKTDTWPDLHPVYHAENGNGFRPPHRELGRLFKIWEHDAQRFHAAIGPLWTERTEGIEATIDSTMLLIPEEIRTEFGSDIRKLLTSYRSINGEIIRSKDFGGRMEERALIDSIQKLRQQIKEERPLLQYKTMLHSAIWLFGKSQLNPAIFQKKFRGEWWMEILRVFCFIVITISIITCLVIFFTRTDTMIRLLILSAFLYFLYLIIIQRMNEERYVYPMLGMLAMIMFTGIRKANSQRTKRVNG